MLRQRKRAELRAIAKETKTIWLRSPLKKIMQSKPFNSLTFEDIEVLEKGEHPDKALQDQYETVAMLMLRLRQLQERSVELRSNNKTRHPDNPIQESPPPTA